MKTILSKMPEWPQYIKGQDTLTVGYPWLALGAILALERILQPTWRVLELGSGGSTVFLARRCASVQSFETDATWGHRVQRAVTGLTATVTHCATVEDIGAELDRIPRASMDLVVIDHADPARAAIQRTANRLPLTLMALPTLKVGGWLVVDNYDAFGMREFDWSPFHVITCDEAGGVFMKTRRYSGRGTRLGLLERAA